MPECRVSVPVWRVILWGGMTGLVLALTLHAGYILLGPNFHTVVPGKVYRCAQPDGAELEKVVRRLNIGTVVNLRGFCSPCPWYEEEARTLNRLNVSLEDISMSAGRLPSIHAVRQLIEILDRSSYPILFHCHQGADRTGLASVITRLLKTQDSLDQARQQLHWRRGHVALGRPRNIDRFFALYEEWLGKKSWPHSPKHFRQWALHEYRAGPCHCDLKILHPDQKPLQLVRLQHYPIVVRCTNTSSKPWRFRPGKNAGIHLYWRLLDHDGKMTMEGRSGLFHAVVPPGKSIDLTVALSSIILPGRYRLYLDMMDEQHSSFLQGGSKPVYREVVVW